jgi:hypothetical protein
MTRPVPDLDELRRSQRAARRGEIPTVVGLIVFGVGGVAASRGQSVGLFIGSWIAGVGVLLLIGRVLRDREAKGVGPRGRLATRTLDGEPATVLHVHPARHLLGAAFSLYATVPFVALLVPALRSSAVGGAVLLAALVIPVGLTVGGQLRRALRAGVWLTPSALVVRERDVTSRVAWTDIRTISDSAGASATVFVTAHDPAAVTIVARRRRERRFREGFGSVVIPTAALTLDAPSLTVLLRTCAAPGVAERLGSEAGLVLVRGSRRFDAHA